MLPEGWRAYDLPVLDVASQLFAGVATYRGTRLGWMEGNPILVSTFSFLGVGPALRLFEAKGRLLFLLNRSRSCRLASSALALVAGCATISPRA